MVSDNLTFGTMWLFLGGGREDKMTLKKTSFS